MTGLARADDLAVPVAARPASVIVADAARPASAAAAPIIRVHALTKRFPVRRGWRQLLVSPRSGTSVAVVDEVTLDVRRGEFFGLLGPNGAGKSTLFRMLAASLLPDGGHALVAGHDVVREATAVRRSVALVVADERSLQWRLSARENLRLFAVLHDLTGAEVRRRVDEALTAVGLADADAKLVGTFSSGMRQRLLLARSLLARPQILLLDEPTRSLDPVSARGFRRLLREEIAARHGCTVVLATHTAEEALDLCDRVAVLDRGRLLASGCPDALIGAHFEARYRLWTTAPTHPVVQTLVAEGRATDVVAGEADATGWTCVEMSLRRGVDESAAVLSMLVRGGVPLARFERVQPSLADLLERIVRRAR